MRNPQISQPSVSADAIHTETDHSEEPAGTGESARIWKASGLGGAEFLHGRYRKFAFARHFHPVAALGVVDRGIMRTYCQGRTHRAPAGSVILLNPGDVHDPSAADADGWSFRMLYLSDDLVREIYDPSATPVGFARPILTDAVLYELLLRLHQAFERELDSLQAQSLLSAALAALARSSPWHKRRKLPEPGRGDLERAREYLHAYSSQHVTLPQIALVAGLSPYHFLRSFRAHIGITPHAYLTQTRIERAKSLLASGASLAETAFQSGFADQSHFTRLFKKFTGVTPGKYCSSRCATS